jgi:hypothetical protein
MVNLVTWLLQKDPSHRPSIRDLLSEEYVRKMLGENDFGVPNQLVDNNVISVLGAPPLDFAASASLTSGLQSPTAASSGGLFGASRTGAANELLFPSLQSTVSRNNMVTKQSSQQQQVPNMQITMQSPMPVLGAGGSAGRRTQVQQHPRSGRAQNGTADSGSDRAEVKGNRARGRKKITSEKAKVVHQLQPVRRPSGSGKNATGADSKTVDDDGYDMAQEKEAVRQLEQVLIKEAQSKTSYLRESFDEGNDVTSGVGNERSSARIIEYDLKLDESISRQHITTVMEASLTDDSDAKSSCFYTEIENKTSRNGSKLSEAKERSSGRPLSGNLGAKFIPTEEDLHSLIEEEFSDDNDNVYDDDFEDEVIEFVDDEMDVMQPESASPTEKRRRGSSIDEDGFTNYSKEDLKRNIEDLIDLVNVSRERAVNAMGQSLFG